MTETTESEGAQRLAEIAWHAHAAGTCGWALTLTRVCREVSDAREPRGYCAAHGTLYRAALGAAVIRLAGSEVRP